ncbi:MAG TPA: pyridoxal-phosphate dependent enzyme [Verrucomicrobiae bacterium]|nr:pyridoxal-phosphate dependent enzyme [Verrucomicrobiae bacterium]
MASDNDPLKPEFPADSPKFPATETYQIDVPGFTNVWLKDESTNCTGTHKDRMAWEIVVTYREFLLAKKHGQIKSIPTMSLISSGSAATAIQTQLTKYNLPNLRVLVDVTISPDILCTLEALGCEIYKTDLAKKALSWQEILLMTNNSDGLDITSSDALDPTTRFYDWLSYEIINNSPDYCFVPFGTGNLYENILNITKREVSSKRHDRRFRGDPKTLQNCNFMGATTNNPNSKADKLYSPHLPFVHLDEQWLRIYKQSGYIGQKSNVFPIKEKCLDEAISLAEALKIDAEPSGIAGLALLLQFKSKVPKDKKILVVNTGKSKISSK